MRRIAIIMFSLVCALLLFNCGDDRLYNGLDKISRSLNFDGGAPVDSAALELGKIARADVKSERCKALYNYIDCFIRYKRAEKIDNDSVLDSGIRYFAANGDVRHLGAACLLKGEILFDRGEREQAVVALKECERIVERENLTELKYRLYGVMGMVNERADEYEIALRYSRKNLLLSQKNRNYKWLADAYNSLAVGYNGLGMKDSAKYYMDKCIPLIDSVSAREKVIILNNLAYFNIETDADYSTRCLERALSIAPDECTYTSLAYIYLNTGKEAKADSLWQKAMASADGEVKEKMLKNMIPYRRKQGETQVADSLTEVLLSLKDKQVADARSRRVRELQIGFDYQMERQRLERQRMWLFVAVVMLCVLAAVAIYRHKYRSLKIRNELLERNRQIQLCQQTIRNLELDGEADKRKIEGQSQTINAIKKQQEETIERGRRLFLEIKAGKTTALWSKTDFADFTDFYATVDTMFTLKLNTDYKNLSPRYKTFLILENEGFDMHETARILSVSPSSLRTIRHRVNAARLS